MFSFFNFENLINVFFYDAFELKIQQRCITSQFICVCRWQKKKKSPKYPKKQNGILKRIAWFQVPCGIQNVIETRIGRYFCWSSKRTEIAFILKKIIIKSLKYPLSQNKNVFCFFFLRMRNIRTYMCNNNNVREMEKKKGGNARGTNRFIGQTKNKLL